MGAKNVLYYGDNLDVLRNYIGDESVDLVYLDPPFNSNVKYNVIFKSRGNDAPAQIRAFDDTWTWTGESEKAYEDLMGTKIGGVMGGLRDAIGTNDLMAYLTMMAIRLIELHRVLKATGSLYLHCDPTASHYLKVVLDSVFGIERFLADITWKRTSAHNDKLFGATSDRILYYSKGKKCTRNMDAVKTPISPETNPEYGREDERGQYSSGDLTGPGVSYGESGRPWKGYDPAQSGRCWSVPKTGKYAEWIEKEFIPGYRGIASIHERLDLLDERGLVLRPRKKGGVPRLKRYLTGDSGVLPGDVWTDINPVSSAAGERMGYPTQKPLSLLERIVKASSNEGDVVLDPFCGCGTAVIAAEKLNRKWIGIDVTHLAVSLIEKRLNDSFGIKPEIVGIPQSLDAARKLAEADKFQFELWAISLIPKLHSNEKQVGDKGVDGRGQIMVGVDENGKPKYEKIIASVKGGKHVAPSMVLELVGSVTNERAAFGILICMGKPTAKMEEAAAGGGLYTTPLGERYQKVQIYTIEDYSSGRKFVGLSTIFFSRTYLLRDQATPMTNTSTVLKKALKKEKDARVSLRIVAVNMVAVQGQRVDDVAQSLMMSDDWVRQWVDRYESGGLDALRDRPRAGRPPKVRKDKLNKIIDDASRKRVRPHEVSDAIKRKTGVGYSSRHVLRLMRGRNLSPKKIQYVHVNHASPAAVSKWQKRERRVIAYHRRKGRTVGWGDESHHRRDDKSNALFWTEQGTPVSGTFTNDPQKVSAHGLLLEDTRHMVRLYDRANSDTFIDFLKEAHRRFGPLLIYEDRASYHQSRKVQEFLRDNPEIVLRYTPVGSPYVNPAEHMWLVKSRSSVSYKYHASFEDFCKDLSEHYRTVHYNIDPIKCMNQRPKRYAKF